MKIVVIGGTGLIGSKVVNTLQAQGHQVIAAAPSTGINTITGEGLAQAMQDTSIVIDLANSPSFADQDVLAFFETSGRNLFAAERAAGVQHHLALSVVGTEKLTESGYFRGKLVQEKLIRESGIPYTIVQSTQFFEFLRSIAQAGGEGQTVRISPALFQPIASDDVAAAVVDYALGTPSNVSVEIAGPECTKFSHMVQRYLQASADSRTVVEDAQALYFGARLSENSLIPGTANPRLGTVNFDAWFAQSQLST